MLDEIRHALRRLLKTPGFTIVAVLTLALGIGANSAIFSVVHGVLLRPLPYEEPERLMQVYTSYPQDEARYPLSAPDFTSVRESNRSFSAIGAYTDGTATITGGGEPEQFEATWMTHELLPLLGIQPVLGRGFVPQDHQVSPATVVLLGHALWQRNFGGDPGVIGKVLTINRLPRTVIGVLPPGFDLPVASQLFMPIYYDSTFTTGASPARRSEWLGVIGRLRPGATEESARADLRAITQRLQADFPETNSPNMGLGIVSRHELEVGDVRVPLLILLGAVGLVLLIACANVANLLLGRAAARESELALRAALGAGRGRIVRQMLVESLVLGLLGGAAGLLLAMWGRALLIAARPADIPRLDDIAIDANVVVFTLGIALLAAVLFGTIPALQATRGNLAGALKEGGRGALSGRAGTRLRSAVVVAETALAVVLLVGAGLLVRSFLQLTSVDPGFRPQQAVSVGVTLPGIVYDDWPKRRAFFGELERRVATLPGVTAVGGITTLPLQGSGGIISFGVPGREPLPIGNEIHARVATPGYFAAMGIPLRRGRLFTDRDTEESPLVVVLNEAAAKKWFPDEDPIGRMVRIDWGTSDPREVIGITGDTRQYGLNEEARPEAIIPHAQLSTGFLQLVVRGGGDPDALAAGVRREIRAIDSNLPVPEVQPLKQLVRASVAQPRFYSMLLAIFAAVALALAGIGVFGVMSYTVAQRTREIGIRMALGADPGGVLRLIVGRALLLAGVGLGAGALAALALTRVLRSQLFGVGTSDPVTFVGVMAVLGGVALLASWLPARTATRVDPLVALRHE